MEERVYKYHSDKITIITTIVYFVVIVVVGLLIWQFYAGGYFSAWFISVVAALVALMTLSIPRRVVVTPEVMTVRCVLEIVEIPLTEIVSVRRVKKSEVRWFIPIFASRGFFGYFGYYIDLSAFEFVRVYATEWRNLVEVIDTYDQRYYISCRESETFVAQISEAITHR